MTTKKVYLENDVLVVRFFSKSQEKWREILKEVQDLPLPDREFNPIKKYWEVLPLKSNLDYLFQKGFVFDEDVTFLYEKLKKGDNPEQKIIIDEESLSGFYPFQKEGVRFIEIKNGSALIGDEMGLGKTIQALGYLKIHPELRPVIIVCPASLKLNWQKEIKKWLGEDSEVLFGRKTDCFNHSSFSIYIINYDILGKGEIKKVKNKKGVIKTKRILLEEGWWNTLRKIKSKIVIADEIHHISNSTAFKTKAFKKLAVSIKNKIFLSGTPIKNRPKEFFTALKLLNKTLFSNEWKYKMRYCDPKRNGFGWEFNGATNIEELREKVQSVMIRRFKKDVLLDLPKKTKIIVSLECSSSGMKVYNKASEEFLEWSKEKRKKLDVKNKISYLKQLAYIAKRDSVIDWIKEYLSIENKLVVFAYHRKVIEDLKSSFSDSVVVDGSVSMINRDKAVDKFQNGKVPLFIGQIRAAGEGLTLTVASATVTIEFDWNPGTHDQAEDRVHRIGQEADAVFAYYLVGNGTIDVSIAEMIQEKNNVLSSFLDGEEKDFFDSSILKKLIKV